MITLGIAGLNITLDNNFSYIEEQAEEYLSSNEKPDFVVSASEEDLAFEAEHSDFWCSEGYLESIALYRKIAEKIPEYEALVFHGAVIAYKGNAYAVTARSGVGKTTHLRLWLRQFGNQVYILNGDKPILRIIDGKVYAAGTPWRGKEGYGVNGMIPLKGIAFINRATDNYAKKLTPDEAAVKFLSQVYMPSRSSSVSKTLITANNIVSRVPFYKFYVNMESEAAVMARNIFTEGEVKERINL